MSLALVTESPAPDVVTFDDFWSLWLRRVARKDAMKAWARIPEHVRVDVIVGLVAWLPIMRTKDIDYLPYPATWLNGERWTDELPAQAKTLTERVTANPLQGAGPRTQMPEHVRKMIEQMRIKGRAR